MFTAPLKILCQSLRAVKVPQESNWLSPNRLSACVRTQQVCFKSDKKKVKGCGRKCEPTPKASKECPPICPPKQRVLPCTNKEHKCKKPKCMEKEKVPPCYPEKPKRPPPYKGECYHTLACLSGLPVAAGQSGLAGPSSAPRTSAGFHTACGPLMGYRSPIQPCKNPPPGAGSMCCMPDTDKKMDSKKCKKVCMPGCKPALHKRCMKKQMRKFERCCRILPPYPCFSECIREPLRKDPFSECNCNEPKSVCCQDQRKRRKRPPPFKCGC